jgi:hypothetical protein
MNDESKITYFGETDSRNKRVPFGIKAKDRLKHMYVIGKTGMGKSTLLENMAIQDIQNGNGMAFIDPHGGTAEKLLEYVPEHRIKDVVYLAPFDIEYPISFNVMEDIGPEKRHLVLSGLMSAFMKLFGEESFSDRMQYILQNTILALLEYPGANMLGINKMLAEKEYRNKVIANITDPSVKTYWTKEYAGYTERFAAEAIPAIQNKIGQFTSNPLIRNIIGQAKSSFDFRDVMDKGKIMIINLSKGKVGESNANLIGSMIITKIYLAAMSRADAGQGTLAKLPNFYLYVDEFQSFANKSFADILSEARKYKLNLTIAHQYIEQMEEEVRDAVFGNVGTMITFRVGALDAELLEKEFAPTFTAEDLVNLGIYQAYLKLMIDGVSSAPFSARTLPPIKQPEVSFKEEVIKTSRAQFATPREQVEKNIADWHAQYGPKAPPSPEVKKESVSKIEKPAPKKEKISVPAPVVQNTNPLPVEKPKEKEMAQKNPFKDLKVTSEGKVVEKVQSSNTAQDKPEVEDADFVSLKNLSKVNKKDTKGPTQKNLADLKLTLQSVLKKAETDKVASKVETKSKAVPEQQSQKEPPFVKKEQTVPPPKSGQSEIPEDTLRKMLTIE